MQVALQVEQVVVRRRPSGAGRMRGDDARPPWCAGRSGWSPRKIGPISNRAPSGSPRAALRPAASISPGRRRGAHAVEVRGDRVGQHQALVAAAEQLAAAWRQVKDQPMASG